MRVHTSSHGRIRALVAAAAIAAAGIGVAAAPAGAMPISDVQSECGDVSGTFSHLSTDSWSGYVCQYGVSNGTIYRDFYSVRGNYMYTCERPRYGSWTCYVED